MYIAHVFKCYFVLFWNECIVNEYKYTYEISLGRPQRAKIHVCIFYLNIYVYILMVTL